MNAAWAYARTAGTPDQVGASLPHLSGADGVRLRLGKTGKPVVGPPSGATRYEGVWHSGRSRGPAEVVVIPFSGWGCEVHVALRPPERFGGLVLRSPRHLGRIAHKLADEIAKANAEKPVGSRGTKRPDAIRAATPPAITSA
jgi:hypothetical protein